MTFSFDEEAADNLPRVSDDDLITGNEKYRILLGDIDQQGDSWVNIKIRGVLEADASEKSLFYKEGKEEVNLNLGNIKQWVKSIQNSIPEFSNFHFIGDIHTHPITPENNLEKTFIRVIFPMVTLKILFSNMKVEIYLLVNHLYLALLEEEMCKKIQPMFFIDW